MIIQIVDKILPLTREDNQCGFKKAKKLRARAELALLIQEYKEGKDIDLPEQVINLLNECKQTLAAI